MQMYKRKKVSKPFFWAKSVNFSTYSRYFYYLGKVKIVFPLAYLKKKQYLCSRNGKNRCF